MREMAKRECERPLMVDLDGLAALLSCGEYTAKKIAIKAGARMVFGRRSLYSVKKIEQYLDDLAAEKENEM